MVVVTTVYCFVRHSFQSHQLFHWHLLPVNIFYRKTAPLYALTCWCSVFVIVFTSMNIVSISDEDPRVAHASVVLTETLSRPLWWTWRCNFPCRCLVRASTPWLFHARTKTAATYCRKPLRVKRFRDDILENVANASHPGMHVRQHCLRWMQSTAHYTESVHPCWVPFVSTDCDVLKKKGMPYMWSQNTDNSNPQ